VVGSCEHCNDSSGTIKGGGFLDKLSDYRLLDKNLAPQS
jgi:hypothetical protein